jgi:hypothetical protein
MSLTIARAETEPNRSTSIRNRDGRQLAQSTRMTAGTFETPYGVMEFDKYFITDHTLKKREDFVVIRTHEVPLIDETFARINRAAALGKRAVRLSNVVFGAKLNKEAAATTDSLTGASSSMDLEFRVELPVTLNDIAEIAELDVQENGAGLSWLRLSNRQFDFYADNPALKGLQGAVLGVFIPTETPNTANVDPEHIRWEYADALLTPSTTELPGALGDVSLRASLLKLKPGMTAI